MWPAIISTSSRPAAMSRSIPPALPDLAPVDVAGEVEEAAALVLHHRYDVAILDLRLTQWGVREGLQVVDELRRLKASDGRALHIWGSSELLQTHAYPVRRVSEIMKWVRSGDYDRIMSGEYRKRSEKGNPREEAGAATEFYAERFRSIFREFGEGVGKAGDKAADAADKLAGWLRRE